MRWFTLFIILLCNMNVALLAQVKVKSMSDGEKRIYYSSISEAESKLIGLMQSSDNYYSFPSKMFVDLVLNDDRCFEYDFTQLIEASSEATIRRLRIKTSDDGKLRLYSWDVDGGSMSHYIGITSYKNNKGIHSFASPIDSDYSLDNTDDSYIKIGYVACGVTNITTLLRNNGANIYIVKSHSSISNTIQTTILDAYMIDADGLKPCQIFPGDKGYESTISYSTNPYHAFDNGIILKNTELIIPETMESENTYAPYRITGRNLIYKFNGDKFDDLRIAYEDGLYEKLCNFQYNIIIIKTGSWIIRIDKMPDGKNRYASWKNKKVGEEPDLVISNGYCASSEMKEIDDMGLFGAQVVKDEKYIFQNNDYFYEVSWVYEGGYEFTRIHSGKIVVKQNDKVLMILPPNK